jgi:hypothetical protein
VCARARVHVLAGLLEMNHCWMIEKKITAREQNGLFVVTSKG